MVYSAFVLFANHLTKNQENTTSTIIASLTITPSTVTLAGGESATFTISGTFEDGTAVPQSVLSQTTWSCISEYFTLGEVTTGTIVTGCYTYDGSGYYFLPSGETDTTRGNKLKDQSTNLTLPTGDYYVAWVRATLYNMTVTATVNMIKPDDPILLPTITDQSETAVTAKTQTGQNDNKESTVQTLTTDPIVYSVTTTFTYDGNGNLTKTSKQSGTSLEVDNYTYNELDQMTAYSNSSGTSAAYTYSPSGLRATKTVNGLTTRYYLDGELIL